MTVHFLGGLPRSCSTALTAILAQNPRFSVTATSPMLQLVHAARQARNGLDFKALSKAELDERMPHALRGIIDGWFAGMGEPIHFDKCRGWLGQIDLLNMLYKQPRIIAPIRDIRGVVASMEKLYRSNPTAWTELAKPAEAAGATIQGRVESYLSNSPLSIALEWLFEAKQRGQLDEVLVVKAEQLTTNPTMIMRMIHAYLEEEDFTYNFDALEQTTYENDAVHEPFGEHEVQKSLGTLSNDWDGILTHEVAEDIKQRCAWFYTEFYPNAI